MLRHISTMTGVEAVFKSNCFELHGLEGEVSAAVRLVLELDFVKVRETRLVLSFEGVLLTPARFPFGPSQPFHHEIRISRELSNDQRDFIAGKKNGKLNKIAKAADVKIKFETFNDYNFLVDLSSSSASAALHGLTLLQEEWPAEISFHVPEMYHKRIIGIAGKNIQTIMKEFGVYVKFSNAEEFANLGGYNDLEDNVIARTPAKNAVNLENLKQSVMELVGPNDRDFGTQTVLIPRRYHRILLGEKNIFIHDIEAKTGCVVRFPSKEMASDAVLIFGAENQNHIASQMLLDHVPYESYVDLPSPLSQVDAHPFLFLTAQ